MEIIQKRFLLMPIAFARCEFVKRSNGQNACAKSAYASKLRMRFEGNCIDKPQHYNWSHEGEVEHHTILLPEGVDARYKNPEILWNLVEKTERQKNSQVAMELVLALPDDACISKEDRIEMAEKFVQQHMVDKGLAVQIDIHPPTRTIVFKADDKKLGVKKGEGGRVIKQQDGGYFISVEKHARRQKTLFLDPEKYKEFSVKEQNWHAHLLATTRRFDENGVDFQKRKAYDMLPAVRKGRVISGPDWGKLWGSFQNDYFKQRGLSLRVDPNSIVPQEHLGPVRLRGRAFALMEEHADRVEQNTLAAQEPEQILKELTKTQSKFTKEDVDRFVLKHVKENRQKIEQAFWDQNNLLPLMESQSRTTTGYFTSVAVFEEEKRIVRIADRMHQNYGYKFNLAKTLEKFGQDLKPDQYEAMRGILAGKKIACLEGYAGSGKSHLMVALKNAYHKAGYEVRAMGPDSATTCVLKEKGFASPENVSRFLFGYKHGKRPIENHKELWIVDEASKLGNGPLLELLKIAEVRGVQLLLTGDPGQLPSVGRGGMFTIFCQRYGAFVLQEVKRQKCGHQKDITQDLANGAMGAALDKLNSNQSLKWCETKRAAMEELVEQWAVARCAEPHLSTLMVAHSNREVRALNELARLVRLQHKEISNIEYKCQTVVGTGYFSEHDLIEFRKNDATLGVTNGLSGKIIKARADEFVVSVQEDGKRSRRVTFNPKQYSAFQLGYASTFYRCQGRTVNKAYVLHSPQMNKQMFYVGLTRHVEEVQLFISKKEVSSIADLKYQACIQGTKQTTIDYTCPEAIESLLKKEERQKTIASLQHSRAVSDKVRGYGLGAWDAVRGYGGHFLEKHKDKRLSQGFYKPNQTVGGEGSQALRLGKSYEAPINTTSSFDRSSLLKFILLRQGVYSDPEKSIAAAHTVDLPKVTKKELREFETKLDNHRELRSIIWDSLDPAQQKIAREYLNSARHASTLKEITIQDADAQNIEPQQSSKFKEWQEACGHRNTNAQKFKEVVPADKIKELIGHKAHGVISGQSQIAIKQSLNKHQIDASAIDHQLCQYIDPLVDHLFVGEVIRKDRKSFRIGSKGALCVSLVGDKAGTFYDHENQAGGGMLQLIQRQMGFNFKEALNWAQSFVGTTPPVRSPQAYIQASTPTKDAQWTSIKPDPSKPAPSLDQMRTYHKQDYNETGRYPYYNQAGDLLYYTIRLESKKDTSKIVLPLSYGYLPGKADRPFWRIKSFDCEKRPLYRLPQALASSKSTVLIVEGEKTADKALEKFPGQDFVCVTWQGGASAVSKADWGPLKGRKVIVWPDNDSAGYKAGETICSELKALGVQSLKLVDTHELKKHFPQKWDLADPVEGDQGLPLSIVRRHTVSRALDPEAVRSRAIARGLKLKNDATSLDRTNHLLAVVDERLRSDLEKEAKPGSAQVHEKIKGATVNLLIEENRLKPQLTKAHEVGGQMLDRLARQVVLHKARYGVEPSRSQTEVMKQTIREASKGLDFTGDNLVASERILERSCAKALALGRYHHNSKASPQKPELAKNIEKQIERQQTFDKSVDFQRHHRDGGQGLSK